MPYLVAIEFAFALVTAVILLFVSAPYGRHYRAGWGPAIPSRWAWMIMEFPAFAVIAAWVILRRPGPVQLSFLAFWEAHYLYRVFVYPFLLSAPQRPFPLLLAGFGFSFNVLNGFVNGFALTDGHLDGSLNPGILCRYSAGAALFIAGFALHAFSDRHLRLQRRRIPGYSVPTALPFRFVSSPNYLGEIVEWCGWALAVWSPAAFAFAVFTIANLAPRALSNHRWYRATFRDYPPARRILLPGVW